MSEKTNKNSDQNKVAQISIYNTDQALQLCEKITLSALKRLYAKTGNDFNRRLYIGLINDLNSKQAENYAISDSYDLVLDLFGYIADHFYYANLDGVTYYAVNLQAVDNDGISVYKWLYRYLYRMIYRIKVIDTKRVYLDESIDIAVMPDYNIDDYHTYNTIKRVITAMNLTDKQAIYIKYRLRGLSTTKIAEKMRITQPSVIDFQKSVAIKFEKVANKMLDPDILAMLRRKYNL